MKSMTCRELGGPCDLQLTGTTADDVIQAQDRPARQFAGVTPSISRRTRR